jgi:hypothetical protein
MTARNVPTGRLVLFILLNLVDLILTLQLLHQSDGQVYESNPIASWWLNRSGWLGLTAFKLVAILVVVLLLLIIVRVRPRVGSLVLSFGCTLLLAVVAYSTSLAAGLEVGASQPEWNYLRALEADNRALDGEQAEMAAYDQLQRQVAGDLLAHSQSLTDAVKRLRATAHGHSERWLRGLRSHFVGLSDEECVAANLVEVTLRFVANDQSVEQRLYQDFMATYGIPWPLGQAQRRVAMADGVPNASLEIAQHFAAGPRTEGLPGCEIDAVSDEPNRSVNEQ